MQRPLYRIVIIILLLAVPLSYTIATPDPPHSDPGPAVEKLYFKAFNVDRASRDL